MALFNVSTDVWGFCQAADKAGMRTALGVALTQTGSAAITQSGSYTLAFVGTGNATITFPATNGTLATLAGAETLTNKTLTTPTLTTPAIGSGGATFAGSTSGTTTLKASAIASGTVTIPAGNDTLVTLTATQTLTNKTFVSPALGAASAASINGLQISATGSPELDITGDVVFVGSSLTITSSGTTSITLPSGTTTLYGTGSGTITSSQLRTSMTDETGTGALVFANTPTLVTPNIGNATGVTLTLSGALSANSGAFDVSVVSPVIQAVSTLAVTEGDAVSQATSKSTGVTINYRSGEITMNAASLNDATNVKFTVSNTTIAGNDNVIVNHISGGTAGAYQVWASHVQAGIGFDISIRNVSGGTLAESPVIQYTIIGGSRTN